VTPAPGSVVLVLHAHLPYVRHPEHDDHLEERWLFEAMLECYLPLVAVLDGLSPYNPARLTLSLSPPLVAMLDDALLRARFERHLDRLDRLLVALRDDHLPRAALDAHAAALRHARLTWQRIDRDLPGAFARLARAGRLSLWTTALTHALLPLWTAHPWFVHAQVAGAVSAHARRFGAAPEGFWLPECGVAPGVDDALAAHGLYATVVESHALLYGHPRPPDATARPVITPAGVACFGRDVDAAAAVWSRVAGYPAHPLYRDFHEDVGLRAPLARLGDFLAADGSRTPTGVKLWRVTDHHGSAKRPWDPTLARALAVAHADAFAARCARRLDATARRGVRHPVVVAPYDAELFGHWWAEGVTFLSALLNALGGRAVTPGDYLARYDSHPRVTPNPSTWGEGGHLARWVHPAATAMLGAVDEGVAALASASLPPPARRQAMRELCLMAASDWPFLARDGAAAGYAAGRVADHAAALRAIVAGADPAARGQRYAWPADAVVDDALSGGRLVEARRFGYG
jgi:1,4-alpha-glucan branching enzyme